MVAWGNSKAVGMAFGNSKAVGGAWGNQKFAFQTVFEWSGACVKLGSTVQMPRNLTALPRAWIVGGGTAYLGSTTTWSFPRLQGNTGAVRMQIASVAGDAGGSAGPELTPAVESGLRMEFIHATAGTLPLTGITDSTEPYVWFPSNRSAMTAWINAVRNGDNVRVRFIL